MPFLGVSSLDLGRLQSRLAFFLCGQIVGFDRRDVLMGAGLAILDTLRTRLGIAGGLSSYFGFYFLVVGIAMPYFNPWLKSRGLSLSDIAVIAAVAPLVRVVAGPVIGFMADRQGNHRALLVTLSWISAATWVAMYFMQGFWSALAVQILIALTGAALMPLVETLTVASVKAHGIDYGRVRLWGSVTFIVASIVAGWLVDGYGIEICIFLLAGAAILTAASASLLPLNETAKNERRPLKVADALALVSQRRFLLFLLAAGLVQCSHATLYVFGTLHWQSLGISNGWCGALWAISVIAEIVLFAIAGRFSRRIQPLQMIGLGALGGVCRWLAMGFDPPLGMLLPLQLLHALTFAAAHIGAIQYLARTVPAAQAGTAQSLYALVTGGIGMVVAVQIAGVAYLAHAGRAYWAMACFAALALVALWALERAPEPPVNAQE